MKKTIQLYAVIMMTLLSACSSTSNVVVEKKPLLSDHYLMLSLLNRPVTEDQKMMLAFTRQSDNYQNPYFVNTIEIKGDNSTDSYSNSSSKTINSYSSLISQDFNSVRISGPK